MLSLLIAVAVALAPEPKLSEADDFNEVIAGTEEVNPGCRAASFTRHEKDTMRRVLLRCSTGDFVITLALDAVTGWWPLAIEQVSCSEPTPAATDI